MNVTRSNNKKDFVNGQYYWRFNMKFRLNHQGEVDSYYEEALNDVEFWLNQRARGKWTRQKNTIYINHPTDMLMFSMNFNDHIRNVLEQSAWSKEINTTKITKEDEDDVIPTKPSNIIEVDDPADYQMEDIKASLMDDDDEI